MTDVFLPCPTLATMQSYAETAYKAGWKAAISAAVGGNLPARHEEDWFEENPPACAIPEDEWNTRAQPARADVVERVAEVLAAKFEYTTDSEPLVYWREIAKAAIEAMGLAHQEVR